MPTEFDYLNYEAAYWRHAALTKKRVWRLNQGSAIDILRKPVWFGNDEYFRKTLVFFGFVIALWNQNPEHANEVHDANAIIEDLWSNMFKD